jgi:hypothetical protein
MKYFKCVRVRRPAKSTTLELAPGWMQYARIGAEWVQQWLSEKTHARCPICNALFIGADEEEFRERIWRHIEVDHGRETFWT